MARRAKAAGQPVLAVSLHPGTITSTGLMRFTGLGGSMRFMGTCVRNGGGYALLHASFLHPDNPSKSIAQGAATSVYAALAPPEALPPGAYLQNCRPCPARQMHARARDEALGDAVWAHTEQLIAAKLAA